MTQDTTKQQTVSFTIPADIRFEDLELRYDPDGSVSFSWKPLMAICEANGEDATFFQHQAEDVLGEFLVHWYIAHRSRGGAIDTVAEELIGETLLEEQAGQSFSLPAGAA